MADATITSKGQVTIPKPVRDRLGLKAGDQVEFVEENGLVRVRKKTSPSVFKEYRGFLKHLKGADPDRIVEDMRGR